MSSRIGGTMRLLFRWVTVAGATCACLAAFAGTAAASQHPDRMLKRYQPVTVLDGHEAFAPTSVGVVCRRRRPRDPDRAEHLGRRDDEPLARRAPEAPTAACVAQALVPCYRLNQHDCTPAAGTARWRALRPTGSTRSREASSTAAPLAPGGRRSFSTGTSTTTTSTATATRRMTSSGRRTRATGKR